MPRRRLGSLLLVLSLATSVVAAVGGSAGADHTAAPSSVTIAGSLQSELGCPGDWQPECAATHLALDTSDGVWQAVFTVPAGNWEYKAALNDSWDENYPASNRALDLDAETAVKFFYDHATHWVTDDVNSVIATAAGSFQSELGCPGDWAPDCLRSWLQDPDGDGVYRLETTAIPAGSYETKVALDETWDVSYPASNIAFAVAADGDTVTISYDSATNEVTVTSGEAQPPSGPTVAIVGSLQSELGCPGDWQPECAATELTPGADDGVYQNVLPVPAGSWEYKAALNDSWDENYGANAQPNGSNIALVATGDPVKFYYDHGTHWVTDDVNSVIATAAGSFQSELGCPGDWAPDCLRSWLQDPDGDGVYEFTTTALPAGDYATKAALDEKWDVSHPANDLPFTVPSDGTSVTIRYTPNDGDAVEVVVGTAGGLQPGDDQLVRPAVRNNVADEVIYFVMPDRFDNGDPTNDHGGDTGGDPLIDGYLPTDSGFYHGGDLAGLTDRLDYIEGLGVTAIWITPPFTNRWVQGNGTVSGSSAGYHGYWQIDYSQIDPHFGTNQEMKDFIAAAHARGIKVLFDIVANHTGDVITYAEGSFSYRNKTDYPYLDATGIAFDDRDFAGTDTFPPLDPAVSFPYTPEFATSEDATVKNPAWLNDPIYYHNRGNSTFTGENSLYGDFFGLDDLFTEHPDVVDGMIAIHQSMISEYGIDGFRVDTAKHVNDEFWQHWTPAILDHAASEGIDDFVLFGEVFGEDAEFRSRYTTENGFPGVLDFGFDGAASAFAVNSSPTDGLRDLFVSDDWYTDADSNASGLVKFIGNHDVGRFGFRLLSQNAGATDDALVARAELGYGLAYLTRGAPVVYYGDEQGFTGDGGDKAARQDMFPSQVASYQDDDQIGSAATPADDNFDTTHVLYETLADLAVLRADHAALATGAQLHRFSTSTAGIYAFSRIDPADGTEYVVALNNSESSASATFATDSPSTTFNEIYPGSGTVASDATGQLTVELDGLSFVVYRAAEPIPARTEAPTITISEPPDGATVSGRVAVGADVDASPVAVTFAASIDGGPYAVVGTDDNAPYRVYYDAADVPVGATITFAAIVSDLSGNLDADRVRVTVGEGGSEPVAGRPYAVVHYSRSDGDYGDHTTGDFNGFWGLHLWGEGVAESDRTEWTSPKPFLGEDGYGRFAWIARSSADSQVNFIVHRGDTKDGTDADRFFDADRNPEIWLRNDDATIYTTRAEAERHVTVHYYRPDGEYGVGTADYWGLHLWGDAVAPTEGTAWDAPKAPDGVDENGAYWNIALAVDDAGFVIDPTLPVNFIVHQPSGDDTSPGGSREPGGDRSFVPAETPEIFLVEQDVAVHASSGDARDFATIHYHRPAGDYGDYTSSDFNDFWGLHIWDGALNPNPAWQQPVKPAGFDTFGPFWRIDLVDEAPQLAYIIHRGDTKDPGPDQFLMLDTYGHEVWQLQGADPDDPYLLPILGFVSAGNLNEAQAHWVSASEIVWAAADDGSAEYTLHWSDDGSLELTDAGIGGGNSVGLTQAGTFPAGIDGYRHLAGLPVLRLGDADLGLVPQILRGQIAVNASVPGGPRIDATGIQIPGVLDDLYAYEGELGVVWDGDTPTIRLWAPTARDVDLLVYPDADPASTPTDHQMTWDAPSGTWSTTGDASWRDRYYLFSVEVYVPSTGSVETNVVTDPYSFSLSANSARSQIVDLDDPALAPADWTTYEKPALGAFEDISLYELHVRDFSMNDGSVLAQYRGTYTAFTPGATGTSSPSNGMQHLAALADAGLSHVHLLPTFDIATIEERRGAQVNPPFADLAVYPADSDQQQAIIDAVRDQDGFNWGYDPWHYTTPEGSYATDPDGAARVLEYRQMVKGLNDTGLRVVMDVVYNHTNASGQAPKSVLDRIVPGYYHRLNAEGAVETSTCCQNTATEHAMMEKLMVDSLVTWASAYKIDGFRFDLMGHHSLANMQAVRAALDDLTLADDGVDGASIYLYGEGWNFGEVANDARFVQATQLNLAGTGIGSFNDRLRDAVRGGGPFDGGDDLVRNQGVINGLWYDPNEFVAANVSEQARLDELLLSTDQIRVGLAGNLAHYEFVDRNGNLVEGKDVDYNGSPAGYTGDPQEHIVYVAAHDNQTLFDIGQYHHPLTATMEDRVRAQNLGIDFTVLSQGVPFFHAGVDMLRSKSMDRDSYNSGDWFNRLDFTYQDNGFGSGLPVAGVNESNWYLIQPRLADPSLRPAPSDIAVTATHMREMLEIRSGTPLFRLETALDVEQRLAFHNTGPAQVPGVIAMSIDDDPASGPADLDPEYDRIVVVFNPTDAQVDLAVAALAGAELELHPVQAGSADPVVRTASFDAATATLSVPARTTAVYVELAPDSTAPSIDAGFDLVRQIGTNAIFAIRISCTDDRDPEPSTTAALNGIPVEDGEQVFLIMRPGRQHVIRTPWALVIFAPSFELTVTCTDEAGNVATAAVGPDFPPLPPRPVPPPRPRIR